MLISSVMQTRNMVFLSGPTLLLLMTLSLLSAEDTVNISSTLSIHGVWLCGSDYLEVLYPQKTITPVRGSTVKLSCEANYDYKKCGIVHVVWHKIKEEGENSFELTDPSQYFTTVNETITYGNMRCRQVETEIMSVQSPHNGRYQCKATCKSGEQAMGHFITVNIKGRTFN